MLRPYNSPSLPEKRASLSSLSAAGAKDLLARRCEGPAFARVRPHPLSPSRGPHPPSPSRGPHPRPPLVVLTPCPPLRKRGEGERRTGSRFPSPEGRGDQGVS